MIVIILLKETQYGDLTSIIQSYNLGTVPGSDGLIEIYWLKERSMSKVAEVETLQFLP